MKKSRIYISCLIIVITVSCKEKFIPSLQSPETGYLVVEGFISSGQNLTTIRLTRSTKLYNDSNIVYEHNAAVNILGENNEIFPLYENGNGEYVSSFLNLNSDEKYRLQIKTQDNKEYLSDFASVKHTPDIDSVSFTRNDKGVKIYINTHDPLNNTKYYKWDYIETWEFHSTYYSSLVYEYNQNYVPTNVGYRNPDQSVDTTIYKCWNTVNSTNINIGSSEKLSEDKIYLPLVSIEPASVKLSVLYSVNIQQYALSRDAFLFFQKIKKNTEELGSIFDQQPSELKGNIHCVTNPSEQVIGYIDVSEEKQKRIFISNDQVPGWNYSTPCGEFLIDNQPDSLLKYAPGTFPTTPSAFGPFGGVANFYATPQSSCIDCTISGSNVRPLFWP